MHARWVMGHWLIAPWVDIWMTLEHTTRVSHAHISHDMGMVSGVWPSSACDLSDRASAAPSCCFAAGEGEGEDEGEGEGEGERSLRVGLGGSATGHCW